MRSIPAGSLGWSAEAQSNRANARGLRFILNDPDDLPIRI